jgi:hypothetical protein
VDDTLGNALAIEVGQQIDQVEVLEQEGAVLANPLELLGVCNRSAIRCGVDGLLGILEGGSWLIVGTHDCWNVAEGGSCAEDGLRGCDGRGRRRDRWPEQVNV